MNERAGGSGDSADGAAVGARKLLEVDMADLSLADKVDS